MRHKVNREDYHQLLSDIERYDAYYYQHHRPLISDFEYDLLLKKIEEIEKEHPEWVEASSPTLDVRERPTRGFVQVAHDVPMLSLANSYSLEEVEDFIKRIHKLLERAVHFSAELKMDGIAVSLRYEHGKLVRGLTRGDGKQGDDITKNLMMIQSLPHQLKGEKYPALLEVRAEVYMSKKMFAQLNLEKEEAGEEVWANPRNAAAGSLKLLDSREVGKRGLDIVVYGIAQGGESMMTQQQVHTALKKWGLPTFTDGHYALCHDAQELMAFAQNIEKIRDRLPFDIDGIVIKVDTIKDWDILGATGKSPRWAIAYKFAPMQAATIIEAITVQVGRTGVLTPVAELKPIFLAGSTISRATLHNEEEVLRKDIRIGDHVLVEKGGDVIPKVVKVDLTKRPPHSIPWQMPSICPICGEQVTKKAGEVAVRCLNKQCRAQHERRLIFFAGKHAMDIDHLGEKVMLRLIELGLVKDFSDIYRLRYQDLEQIEGFKDKSIQNLLSSIEASKKVSLARFVLALGIPHVGAGTAELIAERAQKVQQLWSLSIDDLLTIEGVGEKVAEAFVSYFQDKTHIQEIDGLLHLGVKPEHTSLCKIMGHLFAGKAFVLTGTLPTLSRTEATEKIQERGGKVTSSVTKQTDYLLLGEDPGSKYDKAKALHVAILTEEEFIQLL